MENKLKNDHKNLQMKWNNNYRPQSKLIPPPPLPRASQLMNDRNFQSNNLIGNRQAYSQMDRPSPLPNNYMRTDGLGSTYRYDNNREKYAYNIEGVNNQGYGNGGYSY